jgi:hypothetical protein
MRVICLSIVVVFAALPAALWAGWELETVASQGDVGTGCSVAVDRWGRPHVTYADKTNSKIVYARYVNSQWEFEDVATDIELLGNTALALDAFDNPHVIFADVNEGEMLYAYRSGGNWTTEVVEEGAGYGMRVAIAAWPTGPRISYTYAVSLSVYLKYAYRENGEWEKETVGGGGLFNRIMADEQQRPHIVDYYSSGENLVVRHSAFDGEDWVDEDIGNGVDSDATAGPDGVIHASFVKSDNSTLYHAYQNGTDWDVDTVGAATGSPAFTQICVNGSKHVFISYFSFDGHDLHLCTNKGSSWTHEVVATGGYVGYPHAIALGSNGYPLIAYYDGDNADLKLARYDPLTDVELTKFTAGRAGGGVDVRWAARDDGGVAGYNLFRAASDGERERVNPSLISGSSPFLFRDADAKADLAYDYWLELVAATGTTRTFGPASVPPGNRALAFALYQNAPNPVADATTFSFELAEGADVRLAIYDAAGRRVAVPAEGYFGPGRHDVPFACGLAPGVYVYRVEAGAHVATRKMVVVD